MYVGKDLAFAYGFNVFIVYLKSCFKSCQFDSCSCLLAKSITAPALACSVSQITEMLLNIVLLNYDLNFLLQETIKLQNMKRSKARVKKPIIIQVAYPHPRKHFY